MLSFTRNQTFDYSDAIIQKYSTGTIASNNVSTEPKVQLLRSSADNIPENIIKDYCYCLPLFVQQRKNKSIVQVLTNPKTSNSGIVVLVISMLVIGGSSYVLIKKKS